MKLSLPIYFHRKRFEIFQLRRNEIVKISFNLLANGVRRSFGFDSMRSSNFLMMVKHSLVLSQKTRTPPKSYIVDLLRPWHAMLFAQRFRPQASNSTLGPENLFSLFSTAKHVFKPWRSSAQPTLSFTFSHISFSHKLLSHSPFSLSLCFTTHHLCPLTTYV